MTISHQLLKANAKIIVCESLLTKRTAAKRDRVQRLTRIRDAVAEEMNR